MSLRIPYLERHGQRGAEPARPQPREAEAAATAGRCWSGCLGLSPGHPSEAARRQMSRPPLTALATLLPFLRPYRARVAGAALALLFAAGLVLLLGQGVRHLIDR